MSEKLNSIEIKRAVNSSIPIVIRTSFISHESEQYIDKVLEKFLIELGHKNIYNVISYCLKELVVNANKANTKRVYFTEKNLDISNEDDYAKGMLTFKDETLSNIQYYFGKQKEAGLYIKIVFQTKSRALYIAIHNNVEITRKEQIRIFDRIARARAFESISEAFAVVLDQTEGAGLGIVILILMLKRIGLSEDVFDITVENGETIARLDIPFSDIHSEQLDMLTEAIVKEINSLPRFPENLVYLQKLIADPESKINNIARQVSTDPTLTAELLKLVNSPIYRVAKKIDNIEEAVKLVGMKGLRNLVYSYGTWKILGKRYSQMKELWNHLNQVALLAFGIARFFIREIKILEDVFVGGILHDLGKILICSLHPDVLDKITNFCKKKGISQSLLEDLSVGLNHAETGALIAAKWNFPDQLVAVIRYHHEPSSADKEYMDVVYVVYLANFISNIEKNSLTFDQIDPVVKKHFKFVSQTDFDKFVSDLKRFVESDRM